MLAPFANHVYACDWRWWEINNEKVRKIATGKRWIQNAGPNRDDDKHHHDAAKQYGLNVVLGMHGSGLGLERIHYGNNSGYQAINLAFLMGAENIILLGFDMKKTGNEVHFFGDHPKQLANGPNFPGIIPLFEPLANDLKKHNVRVINCTPQTALPYFKKQDLKTALRSLSVPGQA